MINHFFIAIIGLFLAGAENLQSTSTLYPVSSSEQLLLQQQSVPRSSNDTSSIATIFEEIQQGVSSGEMKMFSEHFDRHVYINLHDVEGAYFSKNQAYYVLQNYFSNHKVKSFTFTTINTTEELPYATGGGVFFQRGTTEIFQMYIALSRAEDRWVISQFNLY